MIPHRLLERQLRRAGLAPEGPLAVLAEVVSATYAEFDVERRRQERTNQLLADEVQALNTRMRSEAEARVRAILDAVSDGVILVDESGRIDGFNGAAEALFQRSAHDVLGTPFAALWHEGFAAPGQSGEGRARRADAVTIDLDVAFSEASFGGQHCRIAIVRDVSQRKRDEAALRDAMHRAEAASRAKSEFLATMSHEIRTPMNGVLGMVGLLLDGELRPQERGYAEAIYDSGESLLSILNDILDFSKIEAGRMTLEEYDFAPGAVLESVVELLAPRALAKGIEVGVVMDPRVPCEVRGDAGRVRQIVMNLVGNAVKFTEAGSVVVEVARAPGEGLVLELAVTDTGVGIDRAALPTLFGEFVQADASTTRKFGGTGLGLAICKRLVAMMGGEIGVESTRGMGSRFWCRIPFGPSTAATNDRASVGGLRCLVVDDNDVNRQIFERQLRPWGVEVTATASGDGALAELVKAVALKRPFDVAIVDHHMPGMSGVQLGALVRAMPMLEGTRLLLASSGLPEDAAGYFDEVFAKPVRPSALLRALARGREPRALPAGATAGAGASAPTPVTPPEEVVRLRVLVVEDNSINQRVALGYLEKAGHRVDVASNGVEAIAAVRAFPYDVILMDVQMPEMDGLSATRAIRLLGDGRGHVAIIGLTANAMEEDRDTCLAAGMDDYLPKPVERRSLLERVARWGARRRTSPPAARRTQTLAELPPLPPPPPPPGMSPELVQELVLTVGGEATRSLLGTFYDELRGFAAVLPSLAGTALSSRAHQLAGSAGALGFDALCVAAKDVDRIARGAGDPARAVVVLARALGEVIAQFEGNAIERWLAA